MIAHNGEGEGEGPTDAQIKRWRQYLANERAEAAVYRELAKRKEGEEREILLGIADAEARHEQHWLKLLGPEVGMPVRPDRSTRAMAWMARRFGSVFVLAMMQTAETRSPYASDEDATEQMKADEAIHAEVVRGLAARGREQISGDFRAAVFGANDGLVSNLALVLGVMASGVPSNVVLLTGISGLLAGALSMGAGEFISVKSQNELLEASRPHPEATEAIQELDVDANELALVYRARGMSEIEAEIQAAKLFNQIEQSQKISREEFGKGLSGANGGMGGAWSAAVSSFCFFASGALIPILPFLFGLATSTAGIIALVLVSLALMLTGSITGILSGKSPLKRALRQLAIGIGASVVTYLLGLAFGTVVG
ncbi:VIT1/CCC1 transporter family protein [Corynebacterium sp. 70RC1]|uniref:VIT1/CCC1 transporter family protein n=2 Tax=Bacteria TaxID=2 RepID=UPI003593E24E